MKNTKITAVLASALGLGAAAVRGLLYRVAVDDRGLLIRGHYLTVVLLALCAVGAVLAVSRLAGEKTSGLYEENFTPGLAGAIGSVAMAAGIALTLVSGNELSRSNLMVLWYGSGILAGGGLLWAAFSQAKGRRPFLVVYGLVCLFLALHMVSRYQPWSGVPQAMDWAFSMLAAVGMTLCAYHLAAFCADGGHGRAFQAEAVLTVLFCCVALPHTDYFPLYLGGLVWSLTALWEMTGAAASSVEE